VGKTPHPHFFCENHRDSNNPHDRLTPAESARLIRQHVTDGVDLAQKHRLPRAVIDAIRQHHGTTLVRFFYERAVEASRAPVAARTKGEGRKEKGDASKPPAAPPPPIDDSAFRYDGPRPHTKEAAIISLADGVEAATRSLRQVNAGELQQTISRIVNERIADGQLDDAPLTLDEITRVKNSFQFTLLNMLHSRVAYPAGEQPSLAAKA
jgi:membrane-associated HD superfamily phosphohydrolase